MANIQQGTLSNIKNKDLVDTWISLPKKQRKNKLVEKVLNLMRLQTVTKATKREFEKSVGIFCGKINIKWQKNFRRKEQFLAKESKWLNSEIYMTSSLKAILRKPAVPGNTFAEQSTSRGRPYVAFGESSEKTKKRRIEELVSKYTLEELSFAVKELSKKSNSQVEFKEFKKHSLTLQETLALYLQLDLSQRKYNLLRSIINSVHSEFLPSIYKLRQFRDSLLPKDIITTEQGSEINVQQLLDYTLKSILKSILDKEYIKSETLTLTCKYGFDGSSGHSTYKQVFSSTEMTDEYLFLVAMSPLNLSDEKGYIFWYNPRSSSTFFCRPIKFIFVKENSDLVKTEGLKLQQEINDLKPIIINFQNKNYTVNFKFHFTMLDGSCINTLSETNSTQTCFICGATPKQMNTKEVLKQPVKIENFNFGMSSLHSWIRSFECLLHIAYRLPFRSWQVKGTEKKALFDIQKKKIQDDFKRKLGLVVDKPKPGYGSTNDGNTARRFFQNPKISSEITGIDENLIFKFSQILRVVSSGKQINIDNFRELLNNIRELYIELYDWFYMPYSVHKLLVHGEEIIKHFDLPIGQLAEDALETRHKEVRNSRLYHTRKNSRINTNKDIMTYLLVTSDPFISSLRKTTTSHSFNFSDIKTYILEENVNQFDLENISDSD